MGDTKYSTLFDTLKKEILSGKYHLDKPFPSVRGLIGRFGLSDRTVRHALDELFAQGLISRKQGRGTFVTSQGSSRKIGLIIPGVAYSEFFPPIVSQISKMAQDAGYTLLFGDVMSSNPETRARKARRFAVELVRERVAGVIYQPLEFLTNADQINHEIVSIFERARTPVVLLDYDIVSPPERSHYDVIGINNPDAGYRLANHLISCGARKIHFLMRPNWAPSVRNRLRGVITAISAANSRGVRKLKCGILTAEPEDLAALKRHLRRGRPDAFICGNDTAAAKFKQTLEKLGLLVPRDLLLAAFDDVQIAGLLTPPLTTIHQPCAEIGAAAFNRLLTRIATPDLPVQEIYLSAPLIVRESTRVVSPNRKTGSEKTDQKGC